MQLVGRHNRACTGVGDQSRKTGLLQLYRIAARDEIAPSVAGGHGVVRSSLLHDDRVSCGDSQ